MIALISDTHENEAAIQKAVSVIRSRKPEFTVHLGDIISPAMLGYFKGLRMKLLFGNNDGERAGLAKEALNLGFDEPKDEIELLHKGKRVYAYHGTDRERLEQRIWYGSYDYVLTGHTHLRRDGRIKNTRVINPGALFRCSPFTIAFLDVEKDTVEFIEIPK